MNKLKAYIIEDEKHNRDLLTGLLQEHFSDRIEIAGSSASVIESAHFLNTHHADVLFLDIELADGQVFDLLNHIDYRKYKLIFITGYSEHAIKAIRFSAVDYLLKPIISSELIAAINRLDIGHGTDNIVLSDLISRKQFELTDYLIVNNLHSIEKIAFDKIAYLEADGIYTIVHHENRTTVSSKPLGIYEDILPVHLFNRCHKSFIVNKYYIRRVGKGRGLQLTLHDGTELPVAVRKKEEFSLWFRG